MNKKWMYSGAALLALLLSGCGEKPGAAPEEGGLSTPVVVSGGEGNNAPTEPAASASPSPEAVPSPSAEAAVSPSPSAGEETRKETIDVYYTDPQMLDLIPAKAEITFKDDTDKYKEAFKSLQKSGQADQFSLWGEIQLKSLTFSGGQLVMDIHKPAEAQLGSGGESMAMTALTQTLFQFQEVKSIELLVDGEQVESLMGHVELPHPLTRENAGL